MNPTQPLNVAFAGTPEFALPPLRALAARHRIVGVLTQPDRPAGRGRALQASPVKEEALRNGWPLAQPATLRTPEGRAALVQWAPDVLVVVAYGLILPRDVLDLPRLGCLNVHASLLPRWRGAAPIQRAILAGDAETGVTIMRMDAGLDTGPMLATRRVPIDRTTTGGSLHDALAMLGADALMEALDAYAAGTLEPQPQPTEGVTYAAKIAKSEARIDWSAEAAAIERQVRAFEPWPIAETSLDGEQLRVHRAVARDERGAVARDERAAAAAANASTSAAPGSVLGLFDDGLHVCCGRGVLVLQEVQRAGRRRVTAREFVQGLRDVPRSLG